MADAGEIFEQFSELGAVWRVDAVTTVVDEDDPEDADVSIKCVPPGDSDLSLNIELKATDSYDRVKALVEALPEEF